MVFLVTLLSIGSVSAVSNHNSILDISLDHKVNYIGVNDLSDKNTFYSNLSIDNNSSCKNINNKTKVLSVSINKANCLSSCFKKDWNSITKFNCSKHSVGCVNKVNSSNSQIGSVNNSNCSNHSIVCVNKSGSKDNESKVNCSKPSVGCVNKVNCSGGNFKPNMIHNNHCNSIYWKDFYWFMKDCSFNKYGEVCWKDLPWFVRGCGFNKYGEVCWNLNHHKIIWKYFNCFIKDSCSCNSSSNGSGCNSSFNNSSSNCTFDLVNTTTNSSNVVGKVNTKIKVPVNVYVNGSNIKIPIKNVIIIFNGVTKVVDVNDGYISLTLPNKGIYELFIQFKGYDKFKTSNVTVNITVLPVCTKVSVNNICGKPCSHKCIYVNVTDEFGNPIKNGTVSTIINNILYTADVHDGKARFDVNLPKDTGSSPFNVDYAGNDYYDPSYATGIMEIIDNITNIVNHTNNNSYDNDGHANNNKNKSNGNGHNYDPNSNNQNNGNKLKDDVGHKNISDKISKVSALPKTGNPLLILLATLLSLPILRFKK